MNSRPDTSRLVLLIFCSGVAALSYELLWMRQLRLIFGVGQFAVASVLTAYMLGLALGSLLFGRIAERVREPLRAYAFIEIGIGASALVSLFALENFHFFENFYYPVYAEQRLYALSLTRMALCLVILLPPTLLIGGTIPMITKHLASREETLGSDFSTIYYANALGALLGVVLTGFVWVRWLGVTTSYGLAVFLSLAVGLAALRLRGSSLRAEAAPSEAPVFALPAKPGMLAVVFVTGFVFFGYELVWLRLIAIYGRATTYSLTVVLAGFLAGVSLGSFLFSRYADRLTRPFESLTRWSCGSALSGVVGIFCFSLLGGLNLDSVDFPTSLLPIALELSAGFLLSMLVALPFGVIFPLALCIYAGGTDRIGAETGSVYFINTLGAIAGSTLTGFVLIPGLGLQLSVALFIAAQLAIASYGLLLDRESSREGPLQAGFPVLVAAVAALLVLGASDGRHFRVSHPDDTLLWYEEGLSGTVTVVGYESEKGETFKEILVDSEPVAATTPGSVVDAKLLAHIPLLLARAPRSSVTVGFGSGGTSHSMSLYGVDVTAIEIEAAIPRANHLLQENSRGVLENPRLRLVIDDARSFLLATQERFDAIVTDVTNLKYKGNPSLYTVEYFELMRDKLAEGGIAAAWVPLGGASYRDLQILLASFNAVFPHTTVWFYNRVTTFFLIFVGTPERLSISLEDLTPPPDAAADLAILGIQRGVDVASMLFLGEDDVARITDGAPLHTDDRPTLEFSDLSAYLVLSSMENLEPLLASKREDLSSYFEAPTAEASSLKLELARATSIHQNSVRLYREGEGAH